MVDEWLIGISRSIGTVIGLVVTIYWKWIQDRRQRRDLLWRVFLPTPMVKVHDDVARKTTIKYDGKDVAKLTRRQFILRNTSQQVIAFGDLVNQSWQLVVSGRIVKSKVYTGGELFKGKVRASGEGENKLSIDQHALNPGAELKLELLYDSKNSPRAELICTRKDVTITVENIPYFDDNLQRAAQRAKRSALRKRVGLGILGGVAGHLASVVLMGAVLAIAGITEVDGEFFAVGILLILVLCVSVIQLSRGLQSDLKQAKTSGGGSSD